MAAKKLVQTKQPIIEIAFEAGYHSQQAFTQAFRYTYICTPKEYRKIGVFAPKQKKIEINIRKKDIIFLFGNGKGAMAA